MKKLLLIGIIGFLHFPSFSQTILKEESLLFSTSVGTPQKILSGDLANDGDIDLIVSTTEGITVATNDGSGAYTTSYYAVGGFHTFLGDINEDGYPDIASRGQDSLILLFGSSGGSFITQKQVIPSGRVPKGLADLDGDGDLDIILLDDSQYPIESRVYMEYMLFDSVNSTFGSQTAIGNAPEYSDVIVSDFDADGDLDIVWSESTGNIDVYYNDGSLGFSSEGSISNASSFDHLQISDIDENGTPDLVVSGAFGLEYFKNTIVASPPPGFAPNSLQKINIDTWDFTRDRNTFPSFYGKPDVADLNGDGTLDLFIANNDDPDFIEEYTDGYLAVLFNDGSENFSLDTVKIINNKAVGVLAFDDNGSGSSDVFWLSYSGDVYRGTICTNRSDTIPPTGTLVSSEGFLTNQVATTFTLTFSEKVTEFLLSDLTVQGPMTVDNLATSDSISFTFDGTFTGTTQVNIYLYSGSVVDYSCNGNPEILVQLRYDSTAPNPTWNTSYPFITAADTLALELDFNDLMGQVNTTDISVSNATVVEVIAQNNDGLYEILLIPTTTGSVKAWIAEGAVTDSAGNNTLASDTLVFTYDITAPTVSLSSSVASSSNQSSIPVILSFSEFVQVIDGQTLSTNSGTVQIDSVNVDSTLAYFTIRNNASGELLAWVSAPSIVDLAGNSLQDSDTLSWMLDLDAPTVAVSGKTHWNSSPISVALTYSEPIIGFAESVFEVSNGTVDSITTNDSLTYTFTISTQAEGQLVLSSITNDIIDSVGNPATSVNVVRYYDTTAPELSFSTVPSAITNANPAKVTLLASEALNNFNASAFQVSGGAIQSFTKASDSTWEILVNADAEGTIVLSLASGSLSDVAGNPAGSLDDVSWVLDQSAPEISMTLLDSLAQGDSLITLQLSASETLTSWDWNQWSIINGEIDTVTTSDSINFAISVAVSGEGLGSLTVPAGTITDVAGNTNSESASINWMIDLTAPTTTFFNPETGLVTNQPFSVSLFFSESVTTLDSSQILTNNGGISDFLIQDDSSYVFTLSPEAEGAGWVYLPSGLVEDSYQNQNEASDTLFFFYDITQPSVTLNYEEDSNRISFIFSEAVTGFRANQVTADSITLSSWITQDSITFRANALVTGNSGGYLFYAGQQVTDFAGNLNLASDTLEVQIDTVPPQASEDTQVPAAVNSEEVSFTISFSETVTNFSVSLLETENATVRLDSVNADSTVFYVTAIAEAEGNISVVLPAGVVRDISGNLNGEQTLLRTRLDLTVPTAIWLVEQDSVEFENLALSLIIQFSESVQKPDLNRIIISPQENINVDSTTSADAWYIVFQPSQTGTYTLQLLDSATYDSAGNGSVASDPLEITVFDRAVTGLEFTPNTDWKAYPNPATNWITIDRITQISGHTQTIQLVNAQGKTVLEQPVNAFPARVNLKGMSPGLYLLLIQGDSSQQSLRVVIE